MLDFLRNSSQSWLMKLILGAVVLVFVFFGVGSYNSQTLNVLAEINGEMVLLSEYQQVFENALERARQQYKGNLTDEVTNNLRKQSLNNLLGQKLIIQNSQANGFEVTDLELASWIYNNPAFQTDGRFDRRKYTRMLKNQRITENEFERNTREQILLDKFVTFVADGIVISEEQAVKEYDKVQSRIQLSMLEISPAQLAGQVKVTEEQVKQFYDLHPDLFKTSRKFKISAVTFNRKDVEAKLKVRDKEIAKYYQKNQDTEFTTKPSARVRHILVAVPAGADQKAVSAKQQEIQNLYARLLKNKNQFAAIAKAESDDPGSKATGGELGWQQEGVYTSGFEQVIKNLPLNKISTPFRTEFGFHIAEVLERKAGRVEQLEEVSEKIKAVILEKKGERRLKNLAARLEKSLTEKTIDSIASEYGKDLITPRAFGENSKIDGLGSMTKLHAKLNAADSVKSGVIRQGTEGFFVYQLVETIEPEMIALEDIKDKAVSLAKSEALKTLTAQKFAELRDQTQTPEQFQAAGRELKAKPLDITIKFSDVFHPALGYVQELKNVVFAMKADEQVTAITLSGKNYLVLKNGMLPPEKTLTEQQIARLQDQLSQRKAQYILNRIVERMRSQAEIEYNAQLMTALKITS